MDIMNFADGCVRSDRFMSHNASNHRGLGDFMRVHVALVLMVLASALAGCTEEGREERYEENIETGDVINSHDIYLLTGEGSPLLVETCIVLRLPEDQTLVAPFLLLDPISGFDDEGKVDVDNADSIAGTIVLYAWDDDTRRANSQSQTNNKDVEVRIQQANGAGIMYGFDIDESCSDLYWDTTTTSAVRARVRIR